MSHLSIDIETKSLQPACDFNDDDYSARFRSLDVVEFDQLTETSTRTKQQLQHSHKVDETQFGQPNKAATAASAVDTQPQKQAQRQLSSLPGYTERKNLAECSESNPEIVLALVVAAIQSFGDTQHLVSSIAYMVNAALFNPSYVSFCVSLFNSDDGIVVECRRLSGDAFAFAKLRSEIFAAVTHPTTTTAPTASTSTFASASGAGTTATSASASPLRKSSPSSLLFSSGANSLDLLEDDPVDPADLANLITSAASTRVDVAREHAALLVNLSRRAENLPAFRAAAAQFLPLSYHSDLEVRRCAATVLANTACQWEAAHAQLAPMLAFLRQCAMQAASVDQDLLVKELQWQINRAASCIEAI